MAVPCLGVYSNIASDYSWTNYVAHKCVSVLVALKRLIKQEENKGYKASKMTCKEKHVLKKYHRAFYMLEIEILLMLFNLIFEGFCMGVKLFFHLF